MNLFFVRGAGHGAEVITPELTGTLLPGVTRDSLLTIAARRGYRVSQERVSVDQWRAECASGRITEAVAYGTAASSRRSGRLETSKGTGPWARAPWTRSPLSSVAI